MRTGIQTALKKMLQIENTNKWNQVIADAKEAAFKNAKTDAMAKRWENAINKAVEKIEATPEFMTYFADEDYLLVWSDSNGIYSANGVCQCKAFAQNQPCWHRAAARLVRIYFGNAENKNPRFPNEAEADKGFRNIPVSASASLVDGELYDLGATHGRYNAKSDSFSIGNCFVNRAETDFADGICSKHLCTSKSEAGAKYCANHAPYLKNSSTKKPEKVGNIRI